MQNDFTISTKYVNMATIKNITPEAKEKQKIASVLMQLNSKLMRAEIQPIATKAGIARNTVIAYLEGDAPKINTAEKIITAAREIIADRKKTINKLVA